MKDANALAEKLAEKLNEKQSAPRKLLHAIAQHCGTAFCADVLRDTEAIMAAGGMLTQEGDRLRTRGGVFFYLARLRMDDETRNRVFPARTGRGMPIYISTQRPELDWPNRAALFQPLLDHSGKVESVKITVIGRPTRIEHLKDVVVTTLTHTGATPSLPKGVPPLPTPPTTYTVYIGAKQWRKVEPVLDADPNDALIIDGICALDPTLKTISVHATHVSTQGLESARKQAEKTAAPPPPKAKATTKTPTTRPTKATPKLDELKAAAELYRQKIATLEAKPAPQRLGLEMTRKLLQQVEAEIASLTNA